VKTTLTTRIAFLLITVLLSGAPVRGGHTLTAQEQKVLKGWLSKNQEDRLATDEDCDCAGDIAQMKAGYRGTWKSVPDYHPYTATGDFNGDGVEDFAVVVIDSSKKVKNYTLLVFNGPFDVEKAVPNFIKPGLDLKYVGLFYGPPRPKPYRLLLSGFESDSGSLLIPRGQSYVLK
jgi:hypothetical protein